MQSGASRSVPSKFRAKFLAPPFVSRARASTTFWGVLASKENGNITTNLLLLPWWYCGRMVSRYRAPYGARRIKRKVPWLSNRK